MIVLIKTPIEIIKRYGKFILNNGLIQYATNMIELLSKKSTILSIIYNSFISNCIK